MLLNECKIYSDGTHYVAIIPTKRPKAFKLKRPEPEFLVDKDGTKYKYDPILAKSDLRVSTPSDEFKMLYEQTVGNNIKDRSSYIFDNIKNMFDDEDKAKDFVDAKLKNKKRAQEARSIRFRRKATLNTFSYFCTFTYDDNKCTFEEFNKELRIFFNNMSCRHGWKVMMVPEFGKENNRFHFHALIAVPRTSSIPGNFSLSKRFNKKRGKMVDVCENSYFKERFGNNDWQCLSTMPKELRRQKINYVIKYLTKTDSYAFYSRGIPTYIKSSLIRKELVLSFPENINKQILCDDFHVFKDGVDLGFFDESLIKSLGAFG